MADERKTPETRDETDTVNHTSEPNPGQQADEQRPEFSDSSQVEQPAIEEPTPDEWRAALEQAVKQRDEYLNIAQRAQADFVNFKRRNVQVRADAYDEGVRETLAALLPALDNLDRALSALDGESDGKLAEGVRMTRRMMFESMAKLGLEEIPAQGQPFDPDIHHAVMRSAEGEPGTVLEVFEKGYRVKDKIIRYAMVKVAVEKT